MAKGRMIIEFDDAADLLQQLNKLVKGAACCGGNREPTVCNDPPPRTLGAGRTLKSLDAGKPGIAGYPTSHREPVASPSEPQQEPEKSTPAPVIGVLMEGITQHADDGAIEDEPPAPPPAEPQSPEAVQTVDKVLTSDNLAEFTQQELLAYCVKHGVLGVNAEKNTQPFFRGMIEMRIRTHLETVGAGK